MIVRNALLADLEEISSLYVECFSAPPWNEAWSFPDAKQRISGMLEASNCRGLAAISGEKIVGVAIAQIEGWLGKNICVLNELCVHPSSENNGIGTALLKQFIEKLSSEESVVAGYLLTDREGHAQLFYEKFGFSLSTKEDRHECVR